MKRILLLLVALCSMHVVSAQEAVDLGLSVNWATYNIGASTPEEVGTYFIAETKDVYNPEAVKMKDLILPNHTQEYSGNPLYDAAAAYWGDGWRTPTYTEWAELIAYCNWVWFEIKSNGALFCGYRVIGPNGNSIMLPSESKWGIWYQCSTPIYNSKYFYVFAFTNERRVMHKCKHVISHGYLHQCPVRAVKNK